MKEKVKEYSNGELTVVWKAAKCIHAEMCVKTLPNVYDPKGRPWIKPENAGTDELKAQIGTCPSGALSYYMEGENNQESENLETKVEVMSNGPLLVYGTLNITHSDGTTDVQHKTTAFCRCGASGNKPYCDGSHNKEGFQG